MKILKAIIFDMDGVIVDSEPMHNKINQVLFDDLNICITEKEYDSFVGTSHKDMWSLIKGTYNLEQDVETLVKKHIDITYDFFLEADIEPIPGIINLLKDLKNKGYKIALASSSPENLITVIQEKLKIKEYFITSISGEQFNESKPNPEIFIHTAMILGVDPEECIVIEDSKNGVTAAKLAKMKCIGYRNMNSGIQDLSQADWVVNSIEEINTDLLEDMFKCR